MRHRPDRYDIIGLAILGFVVALFVAHAVLPPAPPPEDAEPPLAAPGIGGPAPGIGGIGR
ncbi:MAG: hypothetical protein ACM30I_00870 [Gemmatimonas sp.]